ncbi:MAG: hypothetical protein M1823_005631 [Watsoniomyces obsoletus]|nr:MAG: hypothetical protein M1823_005631 [Watsoniomyces obsoletus]
MLERELPEVVRRRFYETWDDPANRLHGKYHQAASYKLFNCRCLEERHWLRTAQQGEEPPVIVKNAWLIPLRIHLCRRFVERYDVLAFCGAGTFGAVYAARQRATGNLVAVKFEALDTEKVSGIMSRRASKGNGKESEANGGLLDQHGSTWRVNTADPALNIQVEYPMQEESFIMSMVDQGQDPERDGPVKIPHILEVYHHAPILITVMELIAVGPTTELEEAPSLRRVGFQIPISTKFELPMLKSCSLQQFRRGRRIGPREYQPLEKEEAARVSFCLLATPWLIDFGYGSICPPPTGFQRHNVGYLVLNDHRYPPEFFMPELWCPIQRNANGRAHYDWDPAYDVRMIDLWQVPLITYEMLHTHLPWPFAGIQQSHVEMMRRQSEGRESYRQRWRYMVQEPVPGIKEDLPQHAADMFQACLLVDPHRRPTAQGMYTFPWFSGWQEHSFFDFENELLTAYAPPSDHLPEDMFRWESFIPSPSPSNAETEPVEDPERVQGNMMGDALRTPDDIFATPQPA